LVITVFPLFSDTTLAESNLETVRTIEYAKAESRADNLRGAARTTSPHKRRELGLDACFRDDAQLQTLLRLCGFLPISITPGLECSRHSAAHSSAANLISFGILWNLWSEFVQKWLDFLGQLVILAEIETKLCPLNFRES
jgi:hypothetical protein